MTRALCPVLCAAAVLASAAPVWAQSGAAVDYASQVRDLQTALERIPTAAGVSAMARMRKCGFRIQVRGSVVEREARADPTFRLAPGDTTIFIAFWLHPRAGGVPQPATYIARWFIRNGKVDPDTAWAREIQSAPFPIRLDARTRC